MTGAPPRPHLAARALAFGLLTAALYAAVMVVSSRVPLEQGTLLQHLTRNLVVPGDRYHSLRRFREAASSGPVDVVVFGSSHAYRGFDPRIFAARGIRLFNLGSTNQTPLNSLHLARLHLEKLAPTLVLIEVYYPTLSGDGLESCRDLAVNTPPSWSSLRMAASTRNLGAVHFALASLAGLTPGEAGARQSEGDDMYIPGGYLASAGRRQRLVRPGKPIDAEIAKAQLDALAELTRLASARGSRVLWVSHPLPRDHRDAIACPGELHQRLARAATEAGVDFWDYTDKLELDPINDFYDFHHLNERGVERFNVELLWALEAAGYPLGPPRPPG
jgi:hypothetical protein